MHLVAPGLGYNLQFVNGKDTAGMTAKHISQAEERDSIGYALWTTRGPQHMLELLDRHSLERYVRLRAQGHIPENASFGGSNHQHIVWAEFIISMWTNKEDTWKVTVHMYSLCCSHSFMTYIDADSVSGMYSSYTYHA